MKQFTLLLAALAVLLIAVACSPTGGQEPVAGQPTTEAAVEGQGEMKTLFVGPELVDCTGVAPMQCMQVREDPNGEWQLFYNTIEGFTFEPGFTYELRVNVETIANPPADGSSLKYTLVEIVNQTAATESLAPEANGLSGVRWVLVSTVNAAGETVMALADSEVTAEFGPDGQMAGSAGCNRYFASYTVDGGNLTIGQAGSTMMACEPVAVMEQEAQFLAALGTAATWQVEGDTLTISNAAGAPVATFQASEPASLTGGVWSATGYNNGKEAVVSLVADTTITATFTEDGQLNGSAGCNNFMTSYTLDGQNITIQPAASTRKLCPGEGIMEQEAQFLTALTTAATWSISGNELELRTADGALVAHFVLQAAQ
jgi:heat shock protein HslJ